MGSILTATLTGYVGPAKENPFDTTKMQYSVKAELPDGTEVWLNENAASVEGAALEGLQQGAQVPVIGKKNPKGKMKYSVVVMGGPVADAAVAAARAATPPAPKMGKVELIEKELTKTSYLMGGAIGMLNKLVMEYEITDISDEAMLENARQIATGIKIDLKGKI